MISTATTPSCRGKLLRLGIFVGSLVLGLFQTVSAQTCLQDEYGRNTQCTANDVKIAKAANVRDPSTGAAITSCVNGSTFSFVADFTVVTTASARENIGMYFATGGQANALTGTCADNIISPLHADPNVNVTQFPTAPQLGTSQYESLDAAPDTCGDISTNDNNQVITVYVQNALCKPGAGNQVALPNCTSWQQPGGTILCKSAAPGWPYPIPAAAIPGAPSKCNCDSTFTIPVTVQMPSVTVAKNCTISQSQQNLSLCVFSGEGGTVTYNMAITNGSNFGNVIIDQVCDSAYGGLFTAPGYTGNNCAAATGLSSNTCSGLTSVGSTPVNCSFQANVGESADVRDIITVYGHGNQGGTAITPGISNQVEVKSGEAVSTATISKTFGSNNQLCATVTYNVDVANTAATGSDESLTLTGLSDTTFGDITKVQGNVLSTTCSASTATPQSLPVAGTDYKCSFQAQFCAQPSSITATPGVCGSNGFCSAGKSGTTSCVSNSDCDVTCTGIQHTNTINASMYGDEGPTDTDVTITPGGLTVSECVQVLSH